jgi:hypothetical protein
MRRYKLLSATGAFLLWGGWATYVNAHQSARAGVTSGLAQGLGSFLITLVLVSAVTWLDGHFNNRLARLLMPALIAVGTTTSLLALLHWAVGTPRILNTVAPASSVAFVFCLYTSRRLQQGKNNHE